MKETALRNIDSIKKGLKYALVLILFKTKDTSCTIIELENNKS